MTLTQHLQANFDPVQFGRLEELRGLQTAEQMLSIESLRPLLVELVEDPALQQLLVTDADLDGVVCGAPARRVDSPAATSAASPRRRRGDHVTLKFNDDAESLTFP